MSDGNYSTSTSPINTTENPQTIKRDFVGIWIPKEVWLSELLSSSEKCLWAEIRSLHNEEIGGCFASNEYLMRFMGLKDRQFRELLYNLKKHGFLEQVSFDGRQRVIKAIIPQKPNNQEDKKVINNDANQTGGKAPPPMAENRQSLPYILDTSLDNTSSVCCNQPGGDADAPRPSGRSATKTIYKTFSSPHLAAAGFDPKKFQVSLDKTQWDNLLKEWSEEKIIRNAQALSEKLAQDPAYRRKHKNVYLCLRTFLRNDSGQKKNNPYQKPITHNFVKTGNKGEESFFPKSMSEIDL